MILLDNIGLVLKLCMSIDWKDSAGFCKYGCFSYVPDVF